MTAAWFEASRPPVGAHVLATGRYGHGPHHTEAVFYVGGSDVEVIPPNALTAFIRYQRRGKIRLAHRP